MDSDLAKIVTGALSRIETKLDQNLREFNDHVLEDERRYGEYKSDSNAQKAQIEYQVEALKRHKAEHASNRRWWLGVLSGLIVLLLGGALAWAFSMTRLGQMIERIEKKEAHP